MYLVVQMSILDGHHYKKEAKDGKINKITKKHKTNYSSPNQTSLK